MHKIQDNDMILFWKAEGLIYTLHCIMLHMGKQKGGTPR